MIIDALEIVHKISIKLLIVNFEFRVEPSDDLLVNGNAVTNKAIIKCANYPNQPK